jgi:hypothetical protein
VELVLDSNFKAGCETSLVVILRLGVCASPVHILADWCRTSWTERQVVL